MDATAVPMAPSVALTTQGLTADSQGRLQVQTGQQITVTRRITGVAEVCAATATSTAGVSGWGTLLAPSSGTATETVTFANAGEATLGLRCYNSYNGMATATQLRFIVGGTSGGGGCSLPSSPEIRPRGLTEYLLPWSQVFERQYPDAPGYLIPLGSFTPQRSMDGPASASMYLAIPFVAQARVASRISLAPSQPIAAVGYTQYRRGAAFITVSPCAGDFRAPAPESPDMWLRACRAVFNGENVINFGNIPNAPASYCQLQPGQTYYLNVVFAQPGAVNGFSDTCEGTLTRCEINAQPRFEQL
jgi:hypothetical protein